LFDQHEIKALAKANELGVAVVGDRVFEVSKYSKGMTAFPTKKWLLLNHYADEMPLSEAARKVGMPLDQAADFIDSPMAVEWLERQAVIKAKRQKWSDGGEWIRLGDECLEGKKHLAKDQQIVFQAFGDRFMPKAKSDGAESKTVINFNFTAQDVKEAFSRERSFDTEATA
jgi:molybdenum-dependent DNA-binding transcriptional regulator ModE